jgi:hypothetical protein
MIDLVERPEYATIPPVLPSIAQIVKGGAEGAVVLLDEKRVVCFVCTYGSVEIDIVLSRNGVVPDAVPHIVYTRPENREKKEFWVAIAKQIYMTIRKLNVYETASSLTTMRQFMVYGRGYFRATKLPKWAAVTSGYFLTPTLKTESQFDDGQKVYAKILIRNNATTVVYLKKTWKEKLASMEIERAFGPDVQVLTQRSFENDVSINIGSRIEDYVYEKCTDGNRDL